MSEKGDQPAEEEDEMAKYKNLTPEMIEEIEECFEIFDKDKDGHVSYYDLTMLLRWLKFNPTEGEMKVYQEKYDTPKSNLASKKIVYEIVDQKILEPDTLEELIEAMALFDKRKEGRIPVSELRWAMTKLGDVMDEPSVDDLIKEVDSDNKGYVEIIEFAKICFNIKEKKGKD